MSLAARRTRPWIPRDVPGCVLWLEASLGITLNSGKVSAWGDQTGRGNDVTQGTAANQPVYNANPLNGRPTIQFADALSKSLFNTLRPDLAPSLVTMIAVARHTATQAINFIGGRGDTGFKGYWLWYSGDNPGASFGNDVTNVRPFASTADAVNAWHVYVGIYDGASARFYRDGVLGGTLAMTGNLAYAGMSDFVIGNIQGFTPGRFFTGDLAEILLFSNALPAADRSRIEHSLGAKYGIAVT